jgi:hypothetical protein
VGAIPADINFIGWNYIEIIITLFLRRFRHAVCCSSRSTNLGQRKQRADRGVSTLLNALRLSGALSN